MPTFVTFAPTTSGSFSCSVGSNGQAVVWISLAMSTNFLAVAAESSVEEFSS